MQQTMLRLILLSSLIQIRALLAQLLLWNQRRRRGGCCFPCFWVLPSPQQSWFDIHYFDPTIPGDYFRCQLCLNKNMFSVLLNVLRPLLTNFNIGKRTVTEAVQNVVKALCDLKNDYIKFPSTKREIMATQKTFDNLTDLPNVVGAIDGTHKN